MRKFFATLMVLTFLFSSLGIGNQGIRYNLGPSQAEAGRKTGIVGGMMLKRFTKRKFLPSPRPRLGKVAKQLAPGRVYDRSQIKALKLFSRRVNDKETLTDTMRSLGKNRGDISSPELKQIGDLAKNQILPRLESKLSRVRLPGSTKEVIRSNDSKVVSTGGKFWTEKKNVDGIDFYRRNDIVKPDDVIDGTSNLSRMTNGKPPIGSDGNPVQLHHMTQRDGHGIAEVLTEFHSDPAKSKIIHINPRTMPSGIARSQFRTLTKKYWKDRAAEFRRK